MDILATYLNGALMMPTRGLAKPKTLVSAVSPCPRLNITQTVIINGKLVGK